MKKQGGCGVSRDGGRLWGRTGPKYRPRTGAMASLRGRDGRLWGKREMEMVEDFGDLEDSI